VKTKDKWNLRVVIATFGPIGRLPLAPGTWGSGVAVLIWWFFLSALNPFIFWAIILLITGLAIWSSDHAERVLDKKDPGVIVIDEVVGQWLTLALVPRQIGYVLIGFVIFRIFDIVKPFPINRSQRLPGGWGIVLDDILAGIYGLIFMLFII